MAAAAALRPGELSEAELKAAIRGATQWQWELGKDIFLKDFPADRYIISVKSKIIWCGNYSTGWMSGCGQRYHVYLIDNHGQVHEFDSPETKYQGHQINVYTPPPEPVFETPLSAEEIAMIKDIPLYDMPFAKKFRAHIARICGRGAEGSSPKPHASSGGAAAAGAGGGAAAATVVRKEVNEDPSELGGGRRKRRVKKTRRRK